MTSESCSKILGKTRSGFESLAVNQAVILHDSLIALSKSNRKWLRISNDHITREDLADFLKLRKDYLEQSRNRFVLLASLSSSKPVKNEGVSASSDSAKLQHVLSAI